MILLPEFLSEIANPTQNIAQFSIAQHICKITVEVHQPIASAIFESKRQFSLLPGLPLLAIFVKLR